MKKVNDFFFAVGAIVHLFENAANEATGDESEQILQNGSEVMIRPPQLEIRFLGTHIRAEGIAGIIGAITIVGVLIVACFGN